MLCKVIRIMKMDDSLLMCLHNIRREKESSGNILTHLACHVISLHTVDCRILIGILLLYLLVVTLQKAENLLICRIGFSYQRSFIPIGNIVSRHIVCAVFHQLVFHHILNLFYAGRTLHMLTIIRYDLGNLIDFLLCQLFRILDAGFCLSDRRNNLFKIKRRLCAASLDNLHFSTPTHSYFICTLSMVFICRTYNILYHSSMECQYTDPMKFYLNSHGKII